MVVLGIDSASTSGWALLDGNKILERGTIDARDPKRIETLSSFVSARARPELVVIEDNYLARGKTMNVDVVKALSRIVGMWEMAFYLRGMPTERMMADAWQKGLLTGLIQFGSKSAERKKAAVMWVKATYGLVVSEDVADAIGIATFVIRRELVARRAAGALPRAAM